MNCTLALRMLDACIDDELDVATAAEIAEHLTACPACAGVRSQRIAVRAALRAASLRNAAPPGLKQAILRGIERSGRTTSQAAMVRWWQALMLGASTAVLGAIGGWWLAQPPSSDMDPQAVVAEHVASLTPAGPRVDVESSDRHTVRPWFQGRIEFAPLVRDLSAQGFDLLGARLERVGDRQAVAVVYRLHSHVINVFQWRGRRDGGQSERETTIQGFNVITWSDRDMEFAAVSDTDSTELKRFAAAYRAP